MKTTKKTSTPMDPLDPPRVGTGPQSVANNKRGSETSRNSGTGTGEDISTNTQKAKDDRQLGDETMISDETTI